MKNRMMVVHRFDDLSKTYLGGGINYLPMELSSSNSLNTLNKVISSAEKFAVATFSSKPPMLNSYKVALK